MMFTQTRVLRTDATPVGGDDGGVATATPVALALGTAAIGLAA